MCSRLAETAEERGVEDATSLRALLVEILDEEMHETEVLESEQVLGGYDYDELSESLVVKESEGKSELESDLEWPSGPVSEVEIPPVSYTHLTLPTICSV